MLAAGCVLPFGLRGQTVALYVFSLSAQTFEQEVGAPCAECVGLLPAYSHYGMVAVVGVAEVEIQINLVVRIGEVVYPTGCVGVDVYDVCVLEVVVACKRTGDCLRYDTAFVVEISGVF